MPNNKPILLLSGGGNQQSLWTELARDYTLAFLYPQAAQLAREMGCVEVISLDEMAHTNDVVEEVANSSAKLTSQIVTRLPDVLQTFKSIYADAGPAALDGQLNNWWAGYCLHHIQAALTRLEAMNQLTKQPIPIAGCVTHEDVAPDTRSLVSWAKAQGIPTIHLPHAACHLLPGSGTDIHRETRTDFIAASGLYMQNWYVGNGFDRKRIEIVGAPQWDGLYGEQLPGRTEARDVLHRDPNRLVLCYAATWGQTTSIRGEADREIDDGLAEMFKVAKDLDADLIIKIHPNDAQPADQYYAQALQLAKLNGLVTRWHTHYILRAADVVIAQGPSNLCVEAAILGTPSCYIPTEGFDFANDWSLPFHGADLHESVTRALASRGDPVWQDFIGYYNAGHPDGNASERALNYIRSIAQVKEPV
jgi:hypothetical protein